MNVRDIVSKYLSENGYDGLFNGHGECGCGVNGCELMPCCQPSPECEPGYEHPGDDEVDFYIMPNKLDWTDPEELLP